MLGQQGLRIGSFEESSPLLGFCGIGPHSNLHLLLQTREMQFKLPLSVVLW